MLVYASRVIDVNADAYVCNRGREGRFHGSKKYFLKIFTFFEKGIDNRETFCYNSQCSARWCGSMAEQLTCNQQVDGSTPFTSSKILGATNRCSKETEYGGIPERPKGADCKSVVSDFGGPNPPAPTRKKHLRLQVLFSTKFALRSSEIASL